MTIVALSKINPSHIAVDLMTWLQDIDELKRFLVSFMLRLSVFMLSMLADRLEMIENVKYSNIEMSSSNPTLSTFSRVTER
mmetsp:Transcript_12494/g.20596  ORF Transcript_12494/g.20596 Transcript_12494/m.20596 type:complete len:81 (+) Transcript_12494:1898-2140(+)